MFELFLADIFLVYCHKIWLAVGQSLVPSFSRLEWWKWTFPIQIILSISKRYSTLYLIKMKLLQELVDWFSSVNPQKDKFTNNYTSLSMLLHYVHSFTDPQTTVNVWITDCACDTETVYCDKDLFRLTITTWKWIIDVELLVFSLSTDHMVTTHENIS